MEKSGILILASKEPRLLRAIFSQFLWSIYPLYLSSANAKGASLSYKLQKNSILPWSLEEAKQNSEKFSTGEKWRKLRGKKKKSRCWEAKRKRDLKLFYLCPFLLIGEIKTCAFFDQSWCVVEIFSRCCKEHKIPRFCMRMTPTNVFENSM